MNLGKPLWLTNSKVVASTGRKENETGIRRGFWLAGGLEMDVWRCAPVSAGCTGSTGVDAWQECRGISGSRLLTAVVGEATPSCSTKLSVMEIAHLAVFAAD